MSQAASAVLPAAPAPGEGAAPRKRGLRISIKYKFAFFTLLLIFVVMSSVGYSLYVQQRKALTREVLGRGQTIAENLAASCREAILRQDFLDLVLLAAKTVQQGGASADEAGFDLRDPKDVQAGLVGAFKELPDDLMRVSIGLVAAIRGEAQVDGEQSQVERKGIENEGIFEAIVVDTQGMVSAHHLGTTEVGKPYKAPAYVGEASVESPFPVYEQETFDPSGRRIVRRLFDIQREIEYADDTGVKKMGVVHLGLSQDLINRVVFNVIMKLTAVTVAAVVLGLLVSYLLVAWLTRPIGSLAKGVLAIAGGDFETRLKVATKDELGELTSSFNEMAVSLGQNETLKNAFTRYVSDAALKQILSDPSGAGLRTRRALVTIFSSDVRGFTSMSETLEPEHVVQVINTYLSLQTEIILKHGGQVDKFVGDATIGVWGKETAHPDDAINTVKAAWEVQEAIAKLNKERDAKGEVSKEIGIGINTGEVIAGNIGSTKKIEYACTGESRTFADALCDDCPAGKVWMSEDTYTVVKDKVKAEKIVFNSSKGHGENLVAYELKGFK